MNADAPYLSSIPGGHCLSTLALRQYIDGTLPKNSLHQVEKHLLDCEFCSNILEDMDVGNEAAPSVQTIASHVNQRITQMVGELPKVGFWTRYRLYISGGIGALILGGGLFLNNANSSHALITQKITLTPPPPVDVPPPPPSPEQPGQSGENPTASVSNPEASGPDQSTRQEKVTVVPPKDPKETVNTSSGASHDVAANGAGKPEQTVAMPPSSIGSASPEAAGSAPGAGAASSAAPPPAVNYADLQITGVKVITKMTKSAGSSHSAGKNGQLNVAKNRGGAAFLPEEMPEYPGGEQAMQVYIEQNFKNPVKDKRVLTGAAVGVMFTVSSKGKISDVEVTKSVGKELDVEIIRLIASMPQWNPAKHKGDITCVLALTVK